ncbi:hypothetical protein AQUCO_04900177v1 [Aquilegia coerulea]|uniref:4Fe-4S ferredoxin-type domain-containing protein n=1 Tax=Aquilegia coerulea TaxID=218851 RepID=A0A2G5CLI3_AQUCA|nr:hypothetical protein AQUCO_04900177v1 [Aquilegia coerulea]PIA31697.1 hypothetical protein AQUCO_04900177v1 [Aquilegia coerulea]
MAMNLMSSLFVISYSLFILFLHFSSSLAVRPGPIQDKNACNCNFCPASQPLGKLCRVACKATCLHLVTMPISTIPPKDELVAACLCTQCQVSPYYCTPQCRHQCGVMMPIASKDDGEEEKNRKCWECSSPSGRCCWPPNDVIVTEEEKNRKCWECSSPSGRCCWPPNDVIVTEEEKNRKCWECSSPSGRCCWPPNDVIVTEEEKNRKCWECSSPSGRCCWPPNDNISVREEVKNPRKCWPCPGTITGWCCGSGVKE